MNIDNLQSQMRKGTLEYCILSVLSRGECYPSEILEKLQEAGLQILEGTLYPLLSRLKNANMLSYRWEESTGGPPRKYFSLTALGHNFLEELKSAWESLATSVHKITNPKTV